MFLLVFVLETCLGRRRDGACPPAPPRVDREQVGHWIVPHRAGYITSWQFCSETDGCMVIDLTCHRRTIFFLTISKISCHALGRVARR